MAGSLQTFTPAYGNGDSLTAGATSASLEIDSSANRPSVVITNDGDDIVYVRTGDSSVVATTADYPILGKNQVSISKDHRHTHIAIIAPVGTPIVHAIAGNGL